MADITSPSEDERCQRKRRRKSGDGGGEYLEHANDRRAIDHQRQPHQTSDPGCHRGSPINGTYSSAAGDLMQQHDFARRQILTTVQRCPLLELPAEIREQIWMHAVTEWTASSNERLYITATKSVRLLQNRAIRMDRFNRPPPPALTRVSHQLRAETLHLYYQLNIFECWRPLFWLKDWSQSTFIDWLVSLGAEQTKWLRQVVLLYKHENELEHDVDQALEEHGFELKPGLISNKQELSEYEMCFEESGLPRHFGRRRRWDRWMAGTSS